ncbi:MAG: ATP phosphoribosyltransferase regulatory subunit, partial [Thermoplasmatales archaeon]
MENENGSVQVEREEPDSGIRDLKGTRVYLPKEQLIRERMLDAIKKMFKVYGYNPIETSILEYYDIAASKYGGGSEILKETYRLTDQGKRELCLRYELTFKFGKLIAMNPDIRLPFKRYEIGKVFRDGPIKTGRLREFTQCDVDV